LNFQPWSHAGASMETWPGIPCPSDAGSSLVLWSTSWACYNAGNAIVTTAKLSSNQGWSDRLVPTPELDRVCRLRLHQQDFKCGSSALKSSMSESFSQLTCGFAHFRKQSAELPQNQGSQRFAYGCSWKAHGQSLGGLPETRQVLRRLRETSKCWYFVLDLTLRS
jgi:hypothetical protein